MRRFLRVLLEFIAGFAGIAILIGALLIWRLSTAPLASTFFTPYVETAVESLIPGTQARIFASAFIWDNTRHRLALRAEDVHLNAADGTPILTIPALDVSVSIPGLLLGRLVPAGLMVDHPQVKLTRAPDGQLYFGGLTALAGGQNAGTDIRSAAADLANDAAHAPYMRRLEIADAEFDIHDEKNGTDWVLNVPGIGLERDGFDLTGEAKVEVTQKDKTSLLDVHYAYDREKNRHRLTGSFAGINPSFLAGSHAGTPDAIFNLPLTGEIAATFDDKFDILDGTLSVHGDAGALVYPQIWDQPRTVKSLDLKASYDAGTGKLDVPQATVDLGGPVLTMTMTGMSPAASASPPRDLDFDLSVKLDNLPIDQFASVWPRTVTPDARDWMAANLSKGTFDHAEAVFKGMLSWNDLNNLTLTESSGTISASGARVTYIPGMPAVEDVSANATFDLNHMTINVAGGIGDLKLLPSTIAITDFQSDTQSIDLPLHISGPLPIVMHIIDLPPLNYAKAIGLPVEGIDGMIDGTLTLHFPLLKDLPIEVVKAKASAKLSNLACDKLLPGHALSQGNGTLELDKDGFAIQDSIAIDKVPVRLDWKELFAATGAQIRRQVTVTGNITGNQWGELGIAPLANTKGPVGVTLHMQQKNKDAATSLNGSLDMTRAAMELDELNWKKPVGTSAVFNFVATMPKKGPIEVKPILLAGPRLSIKGSMTLDPETFEPLTADFDPFVAGRSDATLHFAQTPGEKGELHFEVSGKSFDASGLRGGKEPAHADPRPKEYRLALKHLYTSSFGHIENVKGFAIRDGAGWKALGLHGLADGNHALDIELTEGGAEGKRLFTATCDDFGEALKGLGFTDTVSGGKIEIDGAGTAEGPRTIEGTVKVGSFNVKGLPALVTLMNATSPLGIFNLFNGSMDFDKMGGKFHWEGDQLELSDVRAAGSTVGMNIDGKIDMNTGDANLHGTMAPFSLFNRVLGAIPLIGDMLTGGANQGVLAVSFKIRGSLDNPDVSVNPVSLLTPGFLRNLFFSGKDEDSGTKENAPAPEDQTPPADTNINKSP